MIIKQIDLYIVDGKIVIGNEYDGNGDPLIIGDYVPLSAGLPDVLIVTDCGSYIKE